MLCGYLLVHVRIVVRTLVRFCCFYTKGTYCSPIGFYFLQILHSAMKMPMMKLMMMSMNIIRMAVMKNNFRIVMVVTVTMMFVMMLMLT